MRATCVTFVPVLKQSSSLSIHGALFVSEPKPLRNTKRSSALSAFVSGRPDLDSMASTAAASSTPFYANATLHAGFQDRRAKTPTAGFLHLSAKFSSGLPTSAFRVLKYPSRLRKNLGSVGKPGRTTGVAYATAATEKRLHDFTVTVGVRFLFYRFLKSSAGGFLGDLIKWNFEKFLVDKNGKVVERYPPTTSPFQIEVCVE
ncbi:hypothetical protein BHM03_00026736 [Ensete ventricosum]|nr:hypothetical protein BHM03_00026736 [Ensete ventricosum]